MKSLVENKNDITTGADIKLLVDVFYKKVLPDPVIGFIFTDIVKLSLENHMPIMYSFWGSVLLGENKYSGNPMTKHIELDKKVALTNTHFERWLFLWEQTVRELFEGEKANEAIVRAKNIAAIMQHKIGQSQA